MSELGFSLLAGVTCIVLSLSVSGIVRWLHLRADDTYGLTARRALGRRVTAAVLTPLLWWGIAVPLLAVGLLFPVFAVAQAIWKFLP